MDYNKKYLLFLKETKQIVFESIASNRLENEDIQDIIKHIATRDIEGYTEEVYEFCEEFIDELKRFIGSK